VLIQTKVEVEEVTALLNSGNMQPNQLDPQALNLAKAIRRAETGGLADPYNARGASGETGAYQFMPDTWKQWSGQYLQQPNAEYSVENQNKVAYSRIKELKDQGYNPAQIASMWNSGKAEAYKEGFKGTNKQGVAYDVPAYVQKVSQHYNELKGGGGQAAPIGSTQFQTSVPRPEDEGVLAQLGTAPYQAPQEPSKLNNRLAQGSEALGKLSTGVAEGDVSQIASGGLQTAGALAGGAIDLVDKGLDLATFGGYSAAMDFVGKKVVAPLLEGLGGKNIASEWQTFATEHPEAAKNIGAIGNIVSVIPIFKAARTGMGMVGDAARAGAAKTGFVKSVEDAAKAELRASGASAPSKAGAVLTAQKLKGKMVDPVDTIVDGDFLPDVINDPQGIPRYSATGAMNRLDESIKIDDDLLDQRLANVPDELPIPVLRQLVNERLAKEFANRGEVASAIKKANKIFDDYETNIGPRVAMSQLNPMKRGIREAVNFNSPKLTADVRYQIGDVFMDVIEDFAKQKGIKDIADINFDMATKIRAKEALEFLDQRSVTERPGFRAMVGRRSGDMSTVAGEAVGQSMGIPGIGAAAGRAISNRAISGSGKSVIGKLKSKRTRKRPSLLQTGAALGVLQAQHYPGDPGESQ